MSEGHDGAQGGPEPDDPHLDSGLSAMGRGAWLFVGGVLLGALISFGAFASWVVVQCPPGEQTQQSEMLFSDRVTRVDLEGDLGDVTVIAASAEATGIVVDRNIRWSWREPSASAEVMGEVLSLRSQCRIGVGLLSDDCAVTYVVSVPAHVELRIVTTTGDIRVEGLTGDVDLTTDQGEIEVSGTSGRVVVQTDSAEITATGLLGGEFRGESYWGDISLSFAAPPDLVDLTAERGDVTIVVPRSETPDQYNVQVETDTGTKSINVEEYEGASRGIVAELGMGAIAIYYGQTS